MSKKDGSHKQHEMLEFFHLRFYVNSDLVILEWQKLPM